MGLCRMALQMLWNSRVKLRKITCCLEADCICTVLRTHAVHFLHMVTVNSRHMLLMSAFGFLLSPREVLRLQARSVPNERRRQTMTISWMDGERIVDPTVDKQFDNGDMVHRCMQVYTYSGRFVCIWWRWRAERQISNRGPTSVAAQSSL